MSLLATIRNEKDEAARATLINELTSDELATLQAEILEVDSGIDDNDDSVATLETIVELADIADAVTTRKTTLETEKAAAAEARNAARARIKAATGGEEEEDETEKPVVTDETAEETESAEGGEKTPALAAAGLRSNPAKMNRVLKGVTLSPELKPETHKRASLVAVGQLERHSNGDEFATGNEGRYDLAEEMSFTLEGLDPTAANGKVKIARARWADQYDASRRLTGQSTPDDFKKLDAVTTPSAIAASGGVCLPTNVDYSLDVWASQARPVRDGLAAFQVNRGGLVYRQPNTIGALSGSFTEWSEATDASPGESVKNVLAITCESPVQVYINAMVTRLGFGNLMGQFDPETIASNTDLAMAYAARAADAALWTQIQTFATNTITSVSQLGASRDLFTTIIQTAANYRVTNRLNRDQTLTCIFPIWGLDIIKQDRAMELAHSSDGPYDVFSITDEQINSWFAGYDVKVIWSLDPLTANAGAGTYVNQNFGAFTASAEVPAYPTQVMWNLFIEGSIQFLDGGRLDLGVVRDATLDSTNDYETFVETFENVANRGFSGGVLQIVSTTHPRGGSSATVAIA
jgi:hypothetical protein